MTQPALSVPYYPVLSVIRHELEHAYLDYPSLKCQHAAHVVAHVLAAHYELKEVAGVYLPERIWHAWNHDPLREIYVDLSIDQFIGHTTKITILETTTPLLRQDASKTRRHKQMMQEQDTRLENVIARSKEKAQSLLCSLTH